MTTPVPSLPSPLPVLPTLQDNFDETLLYTHASMLSASCPMSYKRLEFLGCSALHLAVSRVLYDHHDDLDNGKMNSIRQLYVSRENLVRWGQAYEFDKKVIVPQSLTEGRDRFAGEIFNAYLGALSLKSQEAVMAFIKELMLPGLDVLRTEMEQTRVRDVETPTNPQAMQMLNERLQSLNIALPEYAVDDSRNPGPEQFEVRCVVLGNVAGRAHGRAKIEAKRKAADIVFRRGERFLAALRFSAA
jgi:dsRNA-specific ribonuclease